MAATGVRGWISLFRGDLAGGEEILRPLVDTAAENGMVLLLVTILWWLTDVIIERPSNEALAALVEAIELPPAFAEVAGGAWLLSVRGRLRAAQGARAEAEADLRQAGSSVRRDWVSDRCTCHRVPRSLSCCDRMIATRPGRWWPRNWRLPTAPASPGRGASRSARVGLARGPRGGCGDAARVGRGARRFAGAVYEHAWSLVELGAALRRSGPSSGVCRAPAGGDGVGAPLRSGTARRPPGEELLAAGAKPRKLVGYGFAELTASERRIVRLAAEGRSNPEIAQALFVSVKTVETHLSSAYRKLGLSGAGSRRRLAELVAQAVAGPD